MDHFTSGWNCGVQQKPEMEIREKGRERENKGERVERKGGTD